MKKLGFGFMRLSLIDDKFESEAVVKECLVNRYPRSAFLSYIWKILSH